MKRWVFTLFTVLLLLPGLAQAKIFLVDTDDTLRVVTASGVSTIHMYAAWADLTTTTLTPGASDAQVTTATTTVLVAAPGASTQRQIKGLSIRNSHASSSNLITVQFYDGATATELIQYTLLAGETLQWGEDENFRVIDASGQVKGLVAATQSGTWSVTGDTELPSAAALADNTSNPTVPGVAAFLMCYDGSTWDRCQGGLTDTDDGTIAGSQVPTLGVVLNYVYDGTNWVRKRLHVGIEDAAETDGIGLSMAGSVRRDTAASSAGTTGDNATINTDATGLLWTRTIDPCSSTAKTFLPINISTATTTEITPSLAGASTNYYVCSLVLVTNATNIVTLVDDDSDGCGSPTAGMSGGTTTAGWTLAANGGVAFGNGMGSVFKTNGTNRVICLVTSAATQLSGTMTVVAAP